MGEFILSGLSEAFLWIEPWWLDWHKLENHQDYSKRELIRAAKRLCELKNDSGYSHGWMLSVIEDGKRVRTYKFTHLLPEYAGADEENRMMVYTRTIKFIDRGRDGYDVTVEPGALTVFPGTHRCEIIQKLERKYGRHSGSNWDDEEEDLNDLSETAEFPH